MEIPDITKITWQLNVALVGAVFSIFALIYRPEYIYYGFITFLYGVISHMVHLVFETTCLINKKWKNCSFFVVQFILTALWVAILILIY